MTADRVYDAGDRMDRILHTVEVNTLSNSRVVWTVEKRAISSTQPRANARTASLTLSA
jgi:hypothetical protein